MTFSPTQTATSSTSSWLVSVWTTVPTGTLPASSSRSACAATPTAPRATARVLTTATCVTTREPSVTTGSVCPGATATLTMTRPPTNAEVCAPPLVGLYWCRNKEEFGRVLVFLDCDRSCLTCSGHGPASCLSCDANKHKDASGHCVWVNQCDLTSYMDQDGRCHQCHKTCHRCSGPAENQCLSCNKPSFLLSRFFSFKKQSLKM